MPDLTTLLSQFLTDLYGGTFGTTVPVARVRVGDGTSALPSFSFASETALGSGRAAAGTIGLTDSAGGWGGSWVASSGFMVSSTRAFNWTSTGDGALGSIDTQLTRKSAGVVNVTTGYAAGNTAGVATFGPSAVTSITVKGGLVTAIS